MNILHIDRIASPIGEILLVVDGAQLVALDYAGYEPRMLKLLARRYGPLTLEEAADPHGYSTLVRAYLAGDLAALDGIPVNTGGTPFQQQVWQALREIPAGQVQTYGGLAARLGRPSAARAVGMTNSLNPVAIVLPCHRVVGANANLTGYAGGLERKQWLLDHERGVRQ
ncbi:MAG: methylated-DNA--[protein]-cysteine S-methyltransferase [Roseiflexaceae bacterium]|nr:methylated-DNA--[protein]-cysteine S-methyltransferase [Roseiflexaceae bacterium]